MLLKKKKDSNVTIITNVNVGSDHRMISFTITFSKLVTKDRRKYKKNIYIYQRYSKNYEEIK